VLAGPSQVDKSCHYQPLPSPIRRVFYLSREGTGQEHEVAPQPNPHILQVNGAMMYNGADSKLLLAR
jgi:hypothetical protein